MTAPTISRSPDATMFRRRRVAAMTLSGMTAPDIADALGVTVRSVQRARQATGVSQGAAVPLTEDELSRAAAMFADGCSRREVARTLGRSDHALQHHFPGQAWSYVEVGKFSAMVRYFGKVTA